MTAKMAIMKKRSAVLERKKIARVILNRNISLYTMAKMEKKARKAKRSEQSWAAAADCDRVYFIFRADRTRVVSVYVWQF